MTFGALITPTSQPIKKIRVFARAEGEIGSKSGMPWVSVVLIEVCTEQNQSNWRNWSA